MQRYRPGQPGCSRKVFCGLWAAWPGEFGHDQNRRKSLTGPTTGHSCSLSRAIPQHPFLLKTFLTASGNHAPITLPSSKKTRKSAQSLKKKLLVSLVNLVVQLGCRFAVPGSLAIFRLAAAIVSHHAPAKNHHRLRLHRFRQKRPCRSPRHLPGHPFRASTRHGGRFHAGLPRHGHRNRQARCRHPRPHPLSHAGCRRPLGSLFRRPLCHRSRTTAGNAKRETRNAKQQS